MLGATCATVSGSRPSACLRARTQRSLPHRGLRRALLDLEHSLAGAPDMQQLVAILLCLAGSLMMGCARVEGAGSDTRRVIDPSTGQVLLEAQLEDGHLHGEFWTWYPNGEPREHGTWAHGIPVGVRLRWHSTGHMAEQGSFLGGLREGAWPSWYRGGELAWKGTWSGGERQGTWTHFGKAGEVLAVEEWELGTRVLLELRSSRPGF